MNKQNSGAFPLWRFLLLTARDLRLLFASPLVYVVVIAYLILAGVLGFNALIDAGYLTFKPYFQIAPYLMLIIAVVISSNQLLRRRGSLDIVALLPVSTFEYVAAKFFTGVLTLLIPLLLSWSLPVAISWAGWGSPDYGLFWAGTLGLLLLGTSFLAIGLAASSFVKSQTVAFLVAILIAFIMWLPNQLVPFFSDSVKELLLNLSFAYHTTWFAQGLITGADLGYFLGITLFSLAVACFGLTSRHYSARIPLSAILQVIIAFVVALFVALLFMKLPLRADMTRDRLFTLDNATARYVEKLNEDVKIVFFCDQGLPLRLKPYRSEVLTLLRQYERLSGRIEVSVASPSTETKAA